MTAATLVAPPQTSPAPLRRSPRKWRRYPPRLFYAFVAPWALGFVGLTLLPLVYAFVMSLTNFDGSSPRWRFIGLRNYTELIADPVVLSSLARTFVFAAIVVPLSVAGGLGLAVLVNRRIRAVGLVRAIFFLPSVVPVVATAIMWKLIFNRDAGLLNGALSALHIPPITWLVGPSAFYALIILMLWGMGGGMVIMLAGLQGVPAELEEAATVDGANRRQVFFHITVPMMSPVIYFQIVTGTIASLQVLVQPLLLAETNTIAAVANVPDSNHLYMVQVYQEFFGNQRFGYGSAMLWVFFVVILLITIAVQKSSRLWVHYQVDQNED